MTLFVYLFVIFFNIYFEKKETIIKKKYGKIVFIISYFCNFLLLAGYRNTSGFSNDLSNNKLEFSKIIEGMHSNYEAGYVLLNKLGGYVTTDFYMFRAIIIGIFLFLLFISIKKWNAYPYYMISFFSAYLIILSAEQLRYFLAFVFFQISLHKLIFTNSKKYYLFFLCLASMIHLSFLVYIIFLLTKNSFYNKKEKIFCIMMLFVCLVIFLNGNKIPGALILANLIDSEKLKIYFSQTTRFGFLYIFLLHFLSIFLIWFSTKNFLLKNNEEIYIKLKKIESINLIVLVFLPLCMIQLTFYRIFRNMLLINYSFYSQIIYTQSLNSNRKKIFICLSWISLLLWIIIDLTITTKPKSLLIPFFTENIFL